MASEVRPRRIAWTSEGEVSIPTTSLAPLFFVGVEKPMALVSLLPNDGNALVLAARTLLITCWYSGLFGVRKVTAVVNLVTSLFLV